MSNSAYKSTRSSGNGVRLPQNIVREGSREAITEPLVKEKLSYSRWEEVVISGHHVILDKGLLLGNSHHHKSPENLCQTTKMLHFTTTRWSTEEMTEML